MVELVRYEFRGIKVYLDQSDWSDLQHGYRNAPAAEPVLREFAARGDVVFLISYEHFVESSALLGGLEARIDFIRSFPGTLWMTTTGRDIVRQSVLAAFGMSEGVAAEPQRVETRPMSQFSTSEITSAVRLSSAPMRRMLSGMALAERISRKTRQGQTAQQRADHERFMAAFLSGDTEMWLKQMATQAANAPPALRQVGDLLWPAYVRVLRRIHPFVARAASWATERGLLAPPQKKVDPIYTACVLPHLPKESTRDQSSFLKLWRNKAELARVAPSLACTAAVEESVYANVEYEYKTGDCVDRDHAAYAPLADVFTCDKRNVDPISKIIKMAGLQTAVIRSGRLPEVVRVLQGRSGDRAIGHGCEPHAQRLQRR